MLRFAILSAVSLCSVAAAQSPVVVHHHHVYDPNNLLGLFEATSTTFADIPGTTKTVTVPAGQAVLTWTLTTAGQGGLMRPMIGTHAPDTPPLLLAGTLSATPRSDSWATVTEGGTFDVKLQAALSPFITGTPFMAQPDYATSWTLVVFPATAGGVPAVGGVGLGLLVLLLLGVGVVLIARRRGIATG